MVEVGQCNGILQLERASGGWEEALPDDPKTRTATYGERSLVRTGTISEQRHPSFSSKKPTAPADHTLSLSSIIVIHPDVHHLCLPGGLIVCRCQDPTRDRRR